MRQFQRFLLGAACVLLMTLPLTVAASGAVGFPERGPDIDAAPGFQNPPPGYGIVPFYWWLGDPLTRERLAWQLDQMKGMGVSGYQINYAHSDKGGRSYGLTYPSRPSLLSDDWWSLVGWFMQEAKKQGAGISLSDYTLGFGQGWSVDKILREHPEVLGMRLRLGPDGRVTPETVPWSLNPMHPRSGKFYAEEFFGQFERHFPGEGGCGLNFFFSDELGFGVDGLLWSAEFADEFRRRKGYDITPELPALFRDIGPRTPKIRLDYNDVKVALTEEGFFKPVFEWHQQRGMIMGCDHGGRGRDVTEFGDYFRTQRWNQGPGADQPGLGKDLIKAKVASSIAHLYERPRVWLEGFYGSGWGTTSAGLVDATLANYAMGFNLLGIHGMYYSTHGGWWEWAPPDNTFRMPYWPHLRGFMQCQQRLAYLLSQGHHRCDVAILYPVAPVEAGMGGQEAVQAAFQTAQQIYAKGIDFDFIDFQSVDRARLADKQLQVAGEQYRVLILPGMKAVRHSTLQKAVEFQRGGGLVLAVGALPEASDRLGRDDPEVAAMVRELFPNGATADVLAAIPFRDYEGPGYILHRRIGPRDVYAIYNAPQGTVCKFRATGRVELWDPWTGGSRSLPILGQRDGITELALPLTEKEMQLIVFGPGVPELAKPVAAEKPTEIPLDGLWEFELQPTLDNRFGDFHWPPGETNSRLSLRERTSFRGAKGDLIGPEARRLKVADETASDPGWQDPKFDDSKWPTATCGFGPRFWKLGPLPAGADGDETFARLTQVDAQAAAEVGGRGFRWQPYEFSWRLGIEDDCGHQGYHGLKEQVADEFIGLGAIRHGHPSCARVPEPGGSRYYLWTAVVAPAAGEFSILRGGLLPSKAWLNGEPLAADARMAKLNAGANRLLLRYDQIGRGFFVFSTAPPEVPVRNAVFSPAARWIWWPGDKGEPAHRYFRRAIEIPSLPKTARLRITCDNGYTVLVNGRDMGNGNAWQRVQEHDVGSVLRTGSNVLAIDAWNDGADAGVIAELVLRDADGKETRIATDSAWKCSPEQAKGWLEPGFDASAWKAAREISPFEGSLWATHQYGPPKFEEVAATTDEKTLPWNVDLAMRWHNDPRVLPFDTRPEVAQPAGWYRFVAPPGFRAMLVPTRGKAQAWADGKELALTVENGAAVATVAPRPDPVVVALRIEQRRGDYGGAALDDYIRLDCGPGRMTLGDWSKVGVLQTYSGGAWYRRSFTLPTGVSPRQVTLDLGEVVASAEVRVNGKPAGVKVAPPWTLDITALVQPGENRLEVLVCNTLANHYVTIPTHYRGQTTSGLLGPVRLRVQRGP